MLRPVVMGHLTDLTLVRSVINWEMCSVSFITSLSLWNNVNVQ